MKCTLFLFSGIAFTITTSAQNVQLHYDLGEGRKYFTSTIEMFKPDKFGNTFFFIDMNYNVGDIKGVSLAYWEIARAFNLGKSPLAFHAEYNGGLGQWKDGDASGSFTINSTWLTGFEYSINAKDFSKGFTFQSLFKYIQGKHDASFQLTGVWFINFANNKLTFTGYADFWREDNVFNQDKPDEIKTRYVYQSEPQLWFNISSNFSFGSEFEINYNFNNRGWEIMPTIGAKYTF